MTPKNAEELEADLWRRTMERHDITREQIRAVLSALRDTGIALHPRLRAASEHPAHQEILDIWALSSHLYPRVHCLSALNQSRLRALSQHGESAPKFFHRSALRQSSLVQRGEVRILATLSPLPHRRQRRSEMARCSWCNTDPVIAAAQYSGPHATWCPRCSEEQLGGPNSAEIEAQMERAQEIFRRLRLRDDNEGPRLLARALAAVAAETREACARVADDYAAKMRAASAMPHPVTGRENAIALCKQDAGETMAAAIRALAPTSPSAEEK